MVGSHKNVHGLEELERMFNICSIVDICCRNTNFNLKGDNLIKGVNINMSTEILKFKLKIHPTYR